MICPKCHYRITKLLFKKWGDSRQRGKFAPLVCGNCAALLIFHEPSSTLFTPEELEQKTGYPLLRSMKKNDAMWTAIVETQRIILAEIVAARPRTPEAM